MALLIDALFSKILKIENVVDVIGIIDVIYYQVHTISELWQLTDDGRIIAIVAIVIEVVVFIIESYHGVISISEKDDFLVREVLYLAIV